MGRISSCAEPAVYVSTYAKYNAGSLKGAWVNIQDFSDIGEFYEYCAELHKDEMDPEFFFQDSQYIPKSLIGESFIDERLFDPEFWEVYCWLYGELGDYEDVHTVIDELIRNIPDFEPSDFYDYYDGFYRSESEYAERLLDEGLFGKIPDQLYFYIDTELLGRDLLMDYDGFSVEVSRGFVLFRY